MQPATLSIPALLPFFLTACFAGGESLDTDEHAERFARSWLITGAEGWALNPTHTVYRFEEGGSIVVERQHDGSYFEGPAGSWVQEDGVVCWFANTWRSEGASTVVVDAECDNGEQTQAWLEFPFDQSLNSESPQPQLTPANAVPRWNGPQGQFRLCDAVEGDAFQLSCAER